MPACRPEGRAQQPGPLLRVATRRVAHGAAADGLVSSRYRLGFAADFMDGKGLAALIWPRERVGKCHAEIIRENRRGGRFRDRGRCRPPRSDPDCRSEPAASWQNAPPPTTAPQPEPRPGPGGPRARGASSDYTPIEAAGGPAAARRPAGPAGPQDDHRAIADRTTEQGNTVPRHDVFNAAEGVFGKGAQGLADIIEKILQDQGEPNAYIAGCEAGGAFVVGVRYGSGVMHHQVEGDAPSIGPARRSASTPAATPTRCSCWSTTSTTPRSCSAATRRPRARLISSAASRPISAPRQHRADPDPARRRLAAGVNAGYMRFSEHNRVVAVLRRMQRRACR